LRDQFESIRRMPVRLALVVGIDRYGSHLPELNYCVRDAEAVAEALEIENYGFEVSRLTGPEATRAAITRQLVELQAQRPDTLCFFFAGHGVTDATGTYLATADGQPFDEGLEVSRLVMLLADPAIARTTESLVILDCCNAGAAALPGTALSNRRALTPDQVTTAFKKLGASNKAVLGACLADQDAHESGAAGHGIFTSYLLDGLLGGAADHTGKVTLSSLYDYVSTPFIEQTGQTPFFYSALGGGAPLGEGLEPRLAPPLELDELDRLTALAQDLADNHRQRRLSSEWDDWAENGFRAAAQDLSHAVAWFEKELGRHPQLIRRDAFAEPWRTVQRYRADLGTISQGTCTPLGRAVQRLGQGSFGTVWKLQAEDGRSLAYKAYHPNDLGDRSKSSRFRRGYDAMRRLDHPRIVKVSTYTDAPLGFSMDFVDGSNMKELNPSVSSEPLDTIYLLAAIAEAISHAHDRDVVHRDIKPENIVCTYVADDGRWDPRLTDFDLAWINTGTQVTHEGIGNLLYAAPEQFMNFSLKAVSGFFPTLDVFSFGGIGS
jgi:eukaryotic-like serine/threonine-protein kinase